MYLAHVSMRIMDSSLREISYDGEFLIFPGAMGKRSDPKSVVDSKARVIGVGGLRVVDASSFPLLPPGHPSATICEFQELFLK
jgi:hypothetical protein